MNLASLQEAAKQRGGMAAASKSAMDPALIKSAWQARLDGEAPNKFSRAYSDLANAAQQRAGIPVNRGITTTVGGAAPVMKATVQPRVTPFVDPQDAIRRQENAARGRSVIPGAPQAPQGNGYANVEIAPVDERLRLGAMPTALPGAGRITPPTTRTNAHRWPPQ